MRRKKKLRKEKKKRKKKINTNKYKEEIKINEEITESIRSRKEREKNKIGKENK